MLKKFFKKHFKKYNPRARKMQEEGVNVLRLFADTLAKEGIEWWLEFGSLLGMYRDHDFIKGDYDLDFGANLLDAPMITKALLAAGCKIRREYHVVGDIGMEQTFKAPCGLSFDVFYVYPRGEAMIGSGFRRFQGTRHCRPSFFMVHEFTFSPFSTVEAEYKGVKVRIPDNAETHIIEVYGPNYKVYDPLFKDGYNKHKFLMSEKQGLGFRKGLPR